MDERDSLEDSCEIFSQDGVLLKQAASTYMPYINTIGTLYITEDRNQPSHKCLEWKPNDVTVDSDIQDQEWAVVNTIQKRTRTLSGSLPLDAQNRQKVLKIPFPEIKSFRVQSKNRQLTILDGKSDPICKFLFQHGDSERLVTILKAMLKTAPAKRDKNLFVVFDSNTLEYQQLDKSFAELNLHQDGHTLWRLVKSFKEQPYETTFEAFSKVTDYVYRSPDQRDIDAHDRADLNRSLTEFESNTTQTQGDYEVIPKIPVLPQRMEFPRLRPLNQEQWRSQFSCDGAIEDVDSIKILIFRGGVSPVLRNEVWKYLLDYYPWYSNEKERQRLVQTKNDEYYMMKLQWKTITQAQEDNFSDFRDRKSLIEKDVNRTDRNLEFYAGDNNPNLQTLNDILMTYVMYNFDLGYVQGMSDLLSPILQLIKNESDSFWCFVGFMNKVSANFDKSQADMLEQLTNLHSLLAFVDPELSTYFDNHESGNMFFCFRWLLVWFKRELSLEDVMRFWEVLWTGYPCKNFHLLISLAILEEEKRILIDNNYGFTEILKHVNELSGKLDMSQMINIAEGIFYQIKEAEHLTDGVRLILGLPLLGNNLSFENQDVFLDSTDLSNGSQPRCSVENVRLSPDEVCFERSLSLSYS